MRVSKSQIVHGVTDYVKSEILPKMGDDKAVQIILSIAVNAAAANEKMVNAVLDNGIVRALLEDDGSGTYELNGITDAMRTAIDQYGNLPVHVPAIPLLSPREITLKLDAEDVDEMRRRIENAV